MEESTWKTVTLKLKRIACLNLELITFQLLQSPISNAKSVTLMISQLIRLNTFMDIVALDGWLILPFVKYFCSLVQLHYSLLSSFIRKQQLATYHPAVVLDFWSSLQTTLAQPKDFDRLLLTHLRQKDLILLTWIIEIFPLETWNCFRRLGIASWRLELAPEDLFAQQTGRNVELLYRFLRFG